MKLRIASEYPPNFSDLDPSIQAYIQVVEDDSEICSLTGWDLYDITVDESAPAGTKEKVLETIECQTNCIETCKLKSWLPTTQEDKRVSFNKLDVPDRIKLDGIWGN